MHAARVAKLVGDGRMRPMAPGALKIGFRGVGADGPAPALCQGEREDTRSAADVEDMVVRPDAGKFQEGIRQAAAPSSHEVFVYVRIGCEERGHGTAHDKPHVHRQERGACPKNASSPPAAAL